MGLRESVKPILEFRFSKSLVVENLVRLYLPEFGSLLKEDSGFVQPDLEIFRVRMCCTSLRG